MVISRTPFRISFFGGGTDYPSWYLKHGGAVLATTIDKYCYLTCRYLPPFFPHRFRIVWSKIETCQSVDEILHPAVLDKTEFFFKNFLCLWLLNAFGVAEKNNLTAWILETKWDMNKFIQFFPDFFMMMWLSKDEEKTTSTSTGNFTTNGTCRYC